MAIIQQWKPCIGKDNFEIAKVVEGLDVQLLLSRLDVEVQFLEGNDDVNGRNRNGGTNQEQNGSKYRRDNWTLFTMEHMFVVCDDKYFVFIK